MRVNPEILKFTSEDFCWGIAAALIELGTDTLSLDSQALNEAITEAYESLFQHGRELLDADPKFAFALLRVIEDLAPNPNTGALDGFWSVFSRLQPAPVRRGSSRRRLEIAMSRANARFNMERISQPWRDLIRDAATSIARAT